MSDDAVLDVQTLVFHGSATTEEDVVEATKLCMRLGIPMWLHWFNGLAGAVLVIGPTAEFLLPGRGFVGWPLLLVACGVLVLAMVALHQPGIQAWCASQVYRRDPARFQGGQLTLSESGIDIEHPRMKKHTPWKAVKLLALTHRGLFFLLKPMKGSFLIPSRDFDEAHPKRLVIQFVQRQGVRTKKVVD